MFSPFPTSLIRHAQILASIKKTEELQLLDVLLGPLDIKLCEDVCDNEVSAVNKRAICQLYININVTLVS